MSTLSPELILEAVREMDCLQPTELEKLRRLCEVSAQFTALEMLTVPAAAKLLAASEKTIRRRIHGGELPPRLEADR